MPDIRKDDPKKFLDCLHVSDFRPYTPHYIFIVITNFNSTDNGQIQEGKLPLTQRLWSHYEYKMVGHSLRTIHFYEGVGGRNLVGVKKIFLLTVKWDGSPYFLFISKGWGWGVTEKNDIWGVGHFFILWSRGRGGGLKYFLPVLFGIPPIHPLLKKEKSLCCKLLWRRIKTRLLVCVCH